MLLTQTGVVFCPPLICSSIYAKVRNQRSLTDVWRPSNSSFWYADRSVAHPAGVHLLPNIRSNIPKKKKWQLPTHSSALFGNQTVAQPFEQKSYDSLPRLLPTARVVSRLTRVRILSHSFFKNHFRCVRVSAERTITLWRRNFLLNFSTPVFKM